MSVPRNDQVTLVALLLLEGTGIAVDTEDVAIRADALAPGRFRWRKYPQQIDLGLVRNALQDARKRALTAGGALKGWVLTPSGRLEAEYLADTLDQSASKARLPTEQKKWRARERARLLSEPMFRKASVEGVTALSERDLLKLLRLDEYVTGDLRVARVNRFRDAFADDSELGPIIGDMARRLAA